MFAQALITLALVIAGIWLAWRYLVEPFVLDKYYPEDEVLVDAISLQHKIDLLEERRAELEVLGQEVDVTEDLIHVQESIKKLKERLAELEGE